MKGKFYGNLRLKNDKPIPIQAFIYYEGVDKIPMGQSLLVNLVFGNDYMIRPCNNHPNHYYIRGSNIKRDKIQTEIWVTFETMREFYNNNKDLISITKTTRRRNTQKKFNKN